MTYVQLWEAHWLPLRQAFQAKREAEDNTQRDVYTEDDARARLYQPTGTVELKRKSRQE